MIKNKLSNWLPLVISFFVPFAVYLLTMPKTVFLGDNAEFIAAGATLGIPHPPGFPVYVMLTKLFSWIPIGNMVFRINLLSVVSASVVIVLLQIILRKIIRIIFPKFSFCVAKWFAVAGVLLLAFSEVFWQQAVAAEVYSLNLLFVALILFLLLKFWETKNQKFIFTAALMFGLGLGAHPMMVLNLPIFLFVVLENQNFRNLKNLGVVIILALLGVCSYFFLPLRSSMRPALDWGSTAESFQNFLRHITRSSYNDFGVGSSFADKGKFLVSALKNTLDQFFVLLLFGFLGFWFMLKKSRKILFVILGVGVLNIAGIILLRNIEWSFSAECFYSTYYGSAYVMIAIFISVGIAGVVYYLQNKNQKLLVLGLLLAFVPAGGLFAVNYEKNNLSDFKFVEKYTAGMLNNLQPNSVVALSVEGQITDTLIFGLFYQQSVKGLRPDVTIIASADVFPSYKQYKSELSRIYSKKDVTEQRKALIDFVLEEPKFANRPFYTTFIITEELYSDLQILSNGYLYETLPKIQKIDKGEHQDFQISRSDENILLSSYSGQDFLAYYYLAQASLLVQNGDFDRSQDLYIKAINTDNEVGGEDIINFRDHRKKYLKN